MRHLFTNPGIHHRLYWPCKRSISLNLIEPVDGETSLRPDRHRAATARRPDADAAALRTVARLHPGRRAAAGSPVAVEPGSGAATRSLAQHRVARRRPAGNRRLSRDQQGTAPDRRRGGHAPALVSARATSRRPRASLRVSRWAERLRKSDWPFVHEGEPRPFLPGRADARAFPHDIWARCLRRAARDVLALEIRRH